MKIPAFCLHIVILAFPVATLAANVSTTASRDYVQSEIKAATTDIPFEQIDVIKKIDGTKLYTLADPYSSGYGFGCGYRSADGLYVGNLLYDNRLSISPALLLMRQTQNIS